MMVPFGRLTLRPDYGTKWMSYLEQSVPCADQIWELPIYRLGGSSNSKPQSSCSPEAEREGGP
jgi:hypothetical protein